MSALENIMIAELKEEKRHKLVIILFSLLSGILFNYLFYDKPLGLGYLIYIIFLLVLFRWSTREIIVIEKSFEWSAIILILLLSGTFALHANPVLGLINSLLTPFLLAVYSVLATGASSSWSDLRLAGIIFERVFPVTIGKLPKPFLFTVEELKPDADSNSFVIRKIVMGLLISVPILLVIIPLLASADMVFDHYVQNLSKISDYVNFKSIINQAIIIVFVFVYTCGYIWSFLDDSPQTGVGAELGGAQKRKDPKIVTWDPTIVITVLMVINIVYLLFSIVQFSYLYGGNSHTLPVDFTYAEYARRGFFELMAVAIINLSILLACLKFVNKSNGPLYSLLQISLGLLVVFSLNMLFSAHFKMSIYEKAYGLTYLRLFVHYFMGLLLLLFALAFGKIRFTKIPLVKMYIVVSIIFYTALNFINVDKIIASYNIDMYFETGRLDLHYLQNLSSDAVPEMVRLTDVNNHDIRNQVKAIMLTKYQELSQAKPWQSFNYSRYRAHLQLTKYFKENSGSSSEHFSNAR